MENPIATHSESDPPLSLEQTRHAQPSESMSRARRRGAVLARMLYSGDALAALLAAAVAVALLASFSTAGLTFVLCAGLLWPFAAFSIGLYRSDQLATWASAVSEIPRGFVAVMLITWPLFGVAALLQLDQT